MNKILMIGGRGTAILIADQIYDASQRYGIKIEVIGFALDDQSYGGKINGYPILCGVKNALDKYGKYNDIKFIYQLYRPDVLEERVNLLESLLIPPEKFATFIHPSVIVARSVKMGYGNVILANSVVNNNVVLGNCNTINSLCLLGHDSIIGTNNYFAAHISLGSGVTIGDKNFVGLNASIRNGITIKNNCIIGMASNVVKSLDSYKVVYGNPAREKEKLNNIIR
jgi:sugar O-acyltransferase (sialic acid O-acetyltransferase NeuD family)